MRYKVKRFSNQKDLLCLLCCVLSTCIMSKKSLSWVYNFHFCMYNKVHFNIRYRFCTFIPPCGFPRWYLVLLPKRDTSSSTMPDSFFILVFLWKCSLNTSRTKEPQLTAVEPYAMPTIWSTEEETACPGSI